MYQVCKANSPLKSVSYHNVRNDHRLPLLSWKPVSVLNPNTCCELATDFTAHRYICILHDRKTVAFLYTALQLFKYSSTHQTWCKTTDARQFFAIVHLPLDPPISQYDHWLSQTAFCSATSYNFEPTLSVMITIFKMLFWPRSPDVSTNNVPWTKFQPCIKDYYTIRSVMSELSTVVPSSVARVQLHRMLGFIYDTLLRDTKLPYNCGAIPNYRLPYRHAQRHAARAMASFHIATYLIRHLCGFPRPKNTYSPQQYCWLRNAPDHTRTYLCYCCQNNKPDKRNRLQSETSKIIYGTTHLSFVRTGGKLHTGSLDQASKLINITGTQSLSSTVVQKLKCWRFLKSLSATV